MGVALVVINSKEKVDVSASPVMSTGSKVRGFCHLACSHFWVSSRAAFQVINNEMAKSPSGSGTCGFNPCCRIAGRFCVGVTCQASLGVRSMLEIKRVVRWSLPDDDLLQNMDGFRRGSDDASIRFRRIQSQMFSDGKQ
jgi:hypothetical protein